MHMAICTAHARLASSSGSAHITSNAVLCNSRSVWELQALLHMGRKPRSSSQSTRVPVGALMPSSQLSTPQGLVGAATVAAALMVVVAAGPL